jgi:ankyrin repeat protein
MKKIIYALIASFALQQAPVHALDPKIIAAIPVGAIFGAAVASGIYFIDHKKKNENLPNDQKTKLSRKKLAKSTLLGFFLGMSAATAFLFINRFLNANEQEEKFKSLKSQIDAIKIPDQGSYAQLLDLEKKLSDIEQDFAPLPAEEKNDLAQQIADKKEKIEQIKGTIQKANDQLLTLCMKNNPNIDNINRLLDQEFANPNLISNDGWPLITVASRIDIIKTLHAHGADVNETDATHNATPLLAAVFNHEAEKVAFLLRNGANANLSDKYGQNPLGLAFENGDLSIIRSLLNDTTVNLNVVIKNGNTPLHFAVYHAHTIANDHFNKSKEEREKQLTPWLEIINTIINRGADLTIKNKAEKTPQEYANFLNTDVRIKACFSSF